MEKLLQVSFDKSLQGIAFVQTVRDEYGTITAFPCRLVNTVLATMLGLPKDEFTGKSGCTLFPFIPKEAFFQILMSVMNSNDTLVLQQHKLQDDVDQWYQLTITPLDDQVMISVLNISEQKNLEYELNRRQTMDTLIATISSRLLTIPYPELNAYLVEALQQICGYIGADRGSIFLYSEDGKRGSCVNEWCSPGVHSYKESIQNVPLDRFNWSHHKMEYDQLIHLQVDELMPDSTEEKRILTDAMIQPLTFVPLLRDKKTHGFIGFYSILPSKTLDNTGVTLLKTFGTLVSGVLQREQQETSILRANQRLTALNDIDKALLSYKQSNKSPLLMAIKYTHFMIPCNQISVFQLDEITGLAVAKCCIVDGEPDMNPTISHPAHVLYNQPQPFSLQYYPDLQSITPENVANLFVHKQGFQSFILVPLYNQSKCVGVFTLASTEPYFFTNEHQEVALEVAGSLALILHQQQIDEQLQQYTQHLEEKVTERTREIQQLSALQQAILQFAGQAILSTNINGVIQTANQACEFILGTTPDELVGRFIRLEQKNPGYPLLFNTYAVDDQAGPPINMFSDVLSNQGYFTTECLAARKNSGLVPLLLTASTLLDADGVIIGYIGIATDISRLKEVENRLKKTNLELSTVFNGAIDLHSITDLDGHFVNTNHAWELTLGYTKAALTSLTLWDLVHPDELDLSYQARQLLLSNGVLENQISRMRKKDGTYCVLEWNARMIDELMYSSSRDITERQKAEVQLINLNQRLHLATQVANQGIWERNLETGALIWDDHLWQLHGLQPRTDWSFEAFLTIVHPDDRDAFVSQSTPVSKVDTMSTETRIIRPDGAIRYTKSNGLLIRNEQGKPIHALGVVWDITERKLAEKALEASENQYRSLVDHLDEIVFQTDSNGVWVYLNPSWEQITGFTIEESLGKFFLDSVLPEERTSTRALFEDIVVNKADHVRHVIRYIHKAGGYRWIDMFARVILNEKQEITGISGTLTNITERHYAQVALQESELRFREITEFVDIVFWIRDINGKGFTYVSPAYEKFTGQSTQSLYDNPLSFLNFILVEDRARIAAVFNDSKPNATFEFRVWHKDGSVRWLSARLFWVYNDEDVVIRRIGVASDITCSIQSKQILEEALEKERSLNDLKSQFIATASHEFRTPLTAISTSIELVKYYTNLEKDRATTPILIRHADTIFQQASALNELITDTLTISKIEEGEVNVKFESVDLVSLSQDLLELNFTSRTDQRQVNLEIIGHSIPASLDKKLISHILINLLSNAFKFSTEDPIMLITFNDETVIISISDKGIGIPQKDIPNLFGKFFRASNTNSYQGTGLGLAICQEYVKIQNGLIDLESIEGVGTTFRLTFKTCLGLDKI